MNILLLEDNCTELQILYNILKKYWPQFHYTCCQNYNDAQKSILSVQYDIFILDIQLSSASDAFNGITFARYIRSLPAYRTTPVLFTPAPLILSKNVLMKSTATITLKSPIMKLYWFMP